MRHGPKTQSHRHLARRFSVAHEPEEYVDGPGENQSRPKRKYGSHTPMLPHETPPIGMLHTHPNARWHYGSEPVHLTLDIGHRSFERPDSPKDHHIFLGNPAEISGRHEFCKNRYNYRLDVGLGPGDPLAGHARPDR